MQFSIQERLILLNILPREGDFLSLKTIRALREEVSESLRQESESGNLTQQGDRFAWQADAAAEIEISPRAQQLIAERLTALDKQKKLSEQHLGLYERFVGE